MADVKISGLPASTTPLAGTEVLPVVQSGVTKKVAVSDLTAGRAMSALSGTFSGGSPGSVTPIAQADELVVQNSAAAGISILSPDANAGRIAFGTASNNQNVVLYGQYDYGFDVYLNNNQVVNMDTATKNVKVTSGNLVIGTSGKGIDFSATPGTGTSELLADYEEGTWTPNQGSGLTVVGDFSSSGQYTKVGRVVTVSFTLSATTSLVLSAAGVLCTNLPFDAGVNTFYYWGTGTNAASSINTGFQTYTTTIFGTTAIGATSSIYGSITYAATS